jgi:hypothetical protein
VSKPLAVTGAVSSSPEARVVTASGDGTAAGLLVSESCQGSGRSSPVSECAACSPLITFLLASAHRFEGLVGSGTVMDVPSWRGWLTSLTQHEGVESAPDIQQDLLVLWPV